MLRIQISDEHEAIIDDADADLIAGFPWRPLVLKGGLIYVHAWNRFQHFYMHRLIAGARPKEVVDHVNRNGLDNRRRNLRIATHGQNSANRIADRRRSGKTSQYKGVHFDKSRGKWAGHIHVNGKSRALGRFNTEIEAAAAYDRAAVEAWGRFARLNLED